MASKSTVDYACQKCYAPLKLHSSFNDKDKAFLDELTTPFIFEEPMESEIVLPISNSSENHPCHIIPPNELWGKDSDETSSKEGTLFNNSSFFNHRVKVAAYLFDYLSGKTEVDHPLCQDCAEALLNAQDQSLTEYEGEMASLRSYLEYLKSQQCEAGHDGNESGDGEPRSACSDDEVEEEQSTPNDLELTRLEDEEAALEEDLSALVLEEEQLDKKLMNEREAVERRTQELDMLTGEYNEQKRVLLEAEEELRALEARVRYARDQLERLRRTNVVNAAFNIWYEGHMGVINGLRLGRLPSNPVEWPEINAAWGQCVLLLQSMAKKFGHTFQKYRLVPMGSTSSIVSLVDGKDYALYFGGGFKLFGDSKFDQGMVAYLDCVSQLVLFIERTSNSVLPYKIPEKGKIQESGGQAYSIKYQFNQEEHWTKALKYMLITLKWIISCIVMRQAVAGSGTSSNSPPVGPRQALPQTSTDVSAQTKEPTQSSTLPS